MQRYCGGKIPDEKSEGSFDIEKIIKQPKMLWKHMNK